MGRKIFVSYKYKDSNVEELEDAVSPTWPNDYVSYIQEHIINDKSDNIYKGEQSDDDLSDKSEDYIWEHLKDKIYDSTVTIVLVSPNMKEPNKWERNQWIPWEISYSVKKTTRGGRTSQRNALLVVILPDKNNDIKDIDNHKGKKCHFSDSYGPEKEKMLRHSTEGSMKSLIDKTPIKFPVRGKKRLKIYPLIIKEL